MADGNLTTIEQPGTAIAAPSDPIMSLIERAATDPNFDVAKMEKLLEMRERQQAINAKEAFNRAFVAAKKEIKPLVRNQRNQQTNSNYVDLEAVADAIDPILTQFGFAPTFGTAPSKLEGHYCMVCDLLHEDGHEKRYEADIPIDDAGLKGTKNKTETHAFGSTMTYGRRYMKLMIFDIATKDNDGNRRPAKKETISTEQMAELDDLLTRTKSDRKKFFDYAKVTGMAEIHATNFDRLKKILEGKLEQNK